MKRNCQHDTSSIENEKNNEVDFENIVDGFPFITARAHMLPSTSGSNRICMAVPWARQREGLFTPGTV